MADDTDEVIAAKVVRLADDEPEPTDPALRFEWMIRNRSQYVPVVVRRNGEEAN